MAKKCSSYIECHMVLLILLNGGSDEAHIDFLLSLSDAHMSNSHIRMNLAWTSAPMRVIQSLNLSLLIAKLHRSFGVACI